MITAKELIKRLKKVPSKAVCFAYVAAESGIVCEVKNDFSTTQYFIHASEHCGPEDGKETVKTVYDALAQRETSNG